MTNIRVDKHYDLIIIGAGSGNSIPGPEFDDKSIAIIEKGKFGGTCLNVGCIPTKMFVYTSEVAETIRTSDKYNISAQLTDVAWPEIVKRVFSDRIDPIAAGGEAYRRGPETPNIDVYDHHAVFIAPKTLSTGQGTEKCIISGDTIVIATGSRPAIPEIITKSGITYYTNENIMRLPKLPKSMIVMGGSFIALEMSHMFKALGVDVTLVNRSNRLLKRFDTDISDRITQAISEAMTTHLGVTFTDLAEDESGITATLSNGSTIHGEVMLIATGRIPNGDLMDLDKAGIDMAGDRIKVNKYGETTAPGVWALGDVSSPYQLKHVANAEMRTIRHNILHPDELRELPHENVPAAVFTHPQIGVVGLTEQEARDQGINVTMKVQKYGDVAYGWAMNDTENFAKLIADKDTGKLVGAHIIGPQAATLVQQLVTIMSFGLDVRAAARDQYWIHPALPELIENALLGLEF